MDFNEALLKLDNMEINPVNLYEFEVRVIETTVTTVYVMAENYEDAEQQVDQMISKGEIDTNRNFDEYSLEYDTNCYDPDYEEEDE